MGFITPSVPFAERWKIIMKLVQTNTKVMETGADFMGTRDGCVCTDSPVLSASYFKGAGYCVGYCGSHGIDVRNTNAGIALVS